MFNSVFRGMSTSMEGIYGVDCCKVWSVVALDWVQLGVFMSTESEMSAEVHSLVSDQRVQMW